MKVPQFEKFAASAEKPPISPGETFSYQKAKEELDELLSGSEETRREKLDRLKERITYYQKGLMTARGVVLGEICNNPGVSTDSLFGRILTIGFRHGLGPDDYSFIRGGLEEYERRREGIEKLRERYPDNSNLYRFLFGRRPRGEVKIKAGPSLNVCCYCPEDYFWAYCWGDPDMAEMSERILQTRIKTWKETGMERVGIFFNVGLPNEHLNGLVTMQLSRRDFERVLLSEEDEEYNDKLVYDHEVHHFLNDLFTGPDSQKHGPLETVRAIWRKARKAEGVWSKESADRKEQEFPISAQGFSRLKPLERRQVLQDFLRKRRRGAEIYARDEIISYIKEGIPPEYIMEVLTLPAEEGGTYDYLNKEGRYINHWLTRVLGKEHRSFCERSVSYVYGEEYKEVLRRAIRAIDELSWLTSKEKATGLLMNEPITSWPRIVRRFKESQKGKNQVF